MNRISIISKAKRFVSYEQFVMRVAKEVCKQLRVNHVSFEIVLVTNARMRALNATYRHKNVPTNVLSIQPPRHFVFPKSVYRVLGEIYLSPEFIRAHDQDLLHMIVHGILHLLGYDHIRKNESARMERVEKRLLQKLATLRQP